MDREASVGLDLRLIWEEISDLVNFPECFRGAVIAHPWYRGKRR